MNLELFSIPRQSSYPLHYCTATPYHEDVPTNRYLFPGILPGKWLFQHPFQHLVTLATCSYCIRSQPGSLGKQGEMQGSAQRHRWVRLGAGDLTWLSLVNGKKTKKKANVEYGPTHGHPMTVTLWESSSRFAGPSSSRPYPSIFFLTFFVTVSFPPFSCKYEESHF